MANPVEQAGLVMRELSTALSTQRVYNDSASRYHARFRDYGPYREKVLEFVAGVPTGGRVLDLGCGSGVNARLMSDAGLQVTGYDFSEAMVEIARRECPEGDFQLVDLRELPKTGVFDAVLASFCIVHFDHDEALAFLRSLPGLMKPGSSLCSSFMEGRDSGWQPTTFSAEPLFYNYFDRAWVVDILSKAGLELVSASTHDYPEQDSSTTTDVFLRFSSPGGASAGP